MKFLTNMALLSMMTALILAAFNVPVRAAELTVYIWEDYISDKVVEAFEKESGIKIRQVHFDSDKIRDEILASPRGRQFDVVLFDNIAVQIFGKNNHLVAINRAEIPNSSNVDNRWQESCGNFGVPYFYGTLGITYDTTRFATPPQSWADLLRPAKEHQHKVVMIDDMIDLVVPPLLYLGYSINTENEDELKKAYEILLQQMPSVLNYKYALTNVKAQPDGEQSIDMAMGYSGDQSALNEATGRENWAYVIPREGTAIWMDCLAVTAWSGQPKAAARFINYLSAPEVAAQNAEDIYCATPISSAKQHMAKETAQDSELFPTEDVIQNGQQYRILSDNSFRKRGRILEAILKKHEAQ